MLLSNAVRLAQSKGLHLQANKALQLRDEDVALRNVIWWNLYMYDKHLAYRSGRPSVIQFSPPCSAVKVKLNLTQAIDDDDISCPIPTVVIPGHQLNLEFFRNTVNHAKISSLVLKLLSTVKAMQQSPEETLTVVQDLHQELLAWYESLAPCFRSSPPYRAKSFTTGDTASTPSSSPGLSTSGSLIAMHAGSANRGADPDWQSARVLALSPSGSAVPRSWPLPPETSSWPPKA